MAYGRRDDDRVLGIRKGEVMARKSKAAKAAEKEAEEAREAASEAEKEEQAKAAEAVAKEAEDRVQSRIQQSPENNPNSWRDTMTPQQKAFVNAGKSLRQPEDFAGEADMVYIYSKMPVAFTPTLDLGYRVRFPGVIAKPKFDDGVARIHGFSRVRYPRFVWESFIKRYGRMRQVKNGLIFMAETMDVGDARAKEYKAEKTGMDRFDPLNPPPGMREVEPYTKA